MVKIFSLICALLMSISVEAKAVTSIKDNSEEIKHAVRVLKGIDTDITKENAVTILRKAAEKDSVSYAMNSLGLIYMAGIGVERDTTKAVAWLERAAAKGFREACHNLGMLYKDAPYKSGQDFAKACAYFLQGAEAGSVMCIYDAGFMLYKGLGCRQDYKKAAELFQRGADRDHSPCLYMLGLCYRNGYGVEQDEEQSAFFLKRSATLGYSAAIEELHRPYAENWLHEEYLTCDTCGNVPQHMPVIRTDVNNMEMLTGKYKGYLMMYDWSGRYVLGEKPIALTINPNSGADTVEGMLTFATDTVPFRAEVMKDGRLNFTDGGIALRERYTTDGKVPYLIDFAELDVWKDKISGRLSLYSLKLNEPERPMYLELERPTTELASDPENSIDRYERIIATPNPFSTQFDITFELQEESDVYVRLYDIYGKLVFNESLGRIAAGTHTESVMPNVLDGTYVLNVKAGRRILRTIIVKKGGAK